MYNSVQYINQTYYSVFTGYRTRPLDKYIYLYPVLCSIRSIRSQVLDDFTNAGNQNTQAPQSANRQPIRKSWNFFSWPNPLDERVSSLSPAPCWLRFSANG